MPKTRVGKEKNDAKSQTIPAWSYTHTNWYEGILPELSQIHLFCHSSRGQFVGCEVIMQAKKDCFHIRNQRWQRLACHPCQNFGFQHSLSEHLP
jgi:hypothetical protein